MNVLDYLKSHDPHKYKLDSNQLFKVLDHLLYESLRPVVENTTIFDEVFASTCAWYEKNKKRKLSDLDRSAVINRMLGFIAVRDTDKKLELLKGMRLERSLLFSTVEVFLNRLNGYTKLYHLAHSHRGRSGLSINNRLRKMESNSKSINRKGLYVAVNTAQTYYDLTKEMKLLIFHKYARLIFGKVRSEGNYDTAASLDLSDMGQNYTVAAFKAISKYQVGKGTFKPYLDHWIKDAKTGRDFTHYHGLAFSVPSVSVLEKEGIVNIAQDIDSEEALATSIPGIEQNIVNNSHNIRIVELALYADPEGYARVALGLD